MAELRDVTPPVPVRIRPVTPKRMPLQCVANSSGGVPGSQPGVSGLLGPTPSAFGPRLRRVQRAARVERAPGDAPASTPSWRKWHTHRFQKPEPAGHVRSTRTEGTNNSPVAQWQSGALMRRRSVDRAHLGLPGSSTAQEVCHETDRRRRRVLSRSRASDARASRLRPGSSAVTASCAATRNSTRSSVATTHAHVVPRSRFKRCCLGSGCF